MIKNYFKIAFRNLWKHKTFTALNIGGLAIGITCVVSILLWVEYQYSYNKQFDNASNIYQVMDNQKYTGSITTYEANPYPLAAAMKQDIPEVKNITCVNWLEPATFSAGKNKIAQQGTEVDSTFFRIFKFPVAEGSLYHALDNNTSIVISKKLATALFGNRPAVGKTVKMNADKLYTVTAVIQNMPQNMLFNFDYLIKLDTQNPAYSYLQNWGNASLRIFVELYPKAKLENVSAKIKQVQQKNGMTDGHISFWLFPLLKNHLYHDFVEGKPSGSGHIKFVKMFSFTAFIILLIACINFMNLSTARAYNRSREVGVRKVMGANRKILTFQFLLEALMVSFIAVLAAVALTIIILPFFNSLFNTQIHFTLNALHIIVLLAVAIVCGLLAGSYPALYMSSFNPIKALRKQSSKSSSNGGFIRKTLVVVQFSASVILIISTIVVYQQIQHTKTRDLGFNKEHLIYLPQPGDNIEKHYNAFRNELLKTGVVENAGMSWASPLRVGNSSTQFDWNGKNKGQNISINFFAAAPEYISTVGFELLDGKDFSFSQKKESHDIIINQRLAKIMGEKEGRVGGIIRNGDNALRIIGVVKDFVYNDINNIHAAPLIIDQGKPEDYHMTLYIRLKANTDITKDIAVIKTMYDKLNPEMPFNYKFVDKDFETYFQSEEMLGSLAFIFGGLAIIISCLGLFGLSAYIAEQRTKEVGIRKVLGASVNSITSLLSKDFLKPVLLSCVIAFPMAYWLMHKWLQSYEYRIGIKWWMFLLAGVVAIAIALLTVSFQSIKAAIANPVKSLRTE